MKQTIFITGATGNIGSKLVADLITQNPSAKLILLVRAKSDADAKTRLADILATVAPEIDLYQLTDRVRVISGDITHSALGLSEPEYNRLATKVTHIIHSAAATKFQLPLEISRRVNYLGTQNIMTFALKAHWTGNLRRVAHISTAYVCGKRGGVIKEDQLKAGKQYSNSYEQTKSEAEKFVRNLMPDLPLMIFRPSIVVGDSVTGVTTAFNVLYTPIKLIAQGKLNLLPCGRRRPLDVVPVDYVSRAISHIFLHTPDSVGRTFHIVAGQEAATSAGEIVDRTLRYFTTSSSSMKPPMGTREGVRFVPSVLLRAASRFLKKSLARRLKMISMYEPYLSVSRTFDDSNTQQALQGSGIVVPKFSDYVANILRYCLSANWGRTVKQAA